MTIAACIVGFRNIADLQGCVAALGAQTDTDLEVVICENGGAEAYRALAAALPATLPGGGAVTVIDAGANVGYAGGINVCMRARPDASAWWIVNPDARPEPSALAALRARLTEGDVDAVGGTLFWPDGRVQSHGGHWRGWLGRAESIGNGTVLASRPYTRAEVEPQLDYILGACMLISRGFVDRAGLMREDYFLYCEEIEWCLRAKALGLRLGFAPDARVLHDQGGTTGSAHSLTARPRLPIWCDERNKLLVVRDTTPARLVTAIPATFALAALRFGRARAWRQWRDAIQGWLAGLRNHRGLPPWLAG